MNELEKLREELEKAYWKASEARLDFEMKMNDAMSAFYEVMERAREIERRAGIRSDTNA